MQVPRSSRFGCCLVPSGRMDFGSCVLSDSIMASGGQHGEVLSSTEFYRPELDDWQRLGPWCAMKTGSKGRVRPC